MKKFKYMILDVDGTLTDGKIYMGCDGEIMKAFNCKDGYGISRILPTMGIEPVIITGRHSKIVENRCIELGITQFFQSAQDKFADLSKFLDYMHTTLDQCFYVGDDLNDAPCMAAVLEAGGLTACPADAAEEIKQLSSFVSKYNGGEGAVREIIENLKKDYTSTK